MMYLVIAAFMRGYTNDPCLELDFTPIGDRFDKTPRLEFFSEKLAKPRVKQSIYAKNTDWEKNKAAKFEDLMK